MVLHYNNAMGAQKHKLPFKTAQALFLLVCLVLLSRVHLPIRCNQGFLQSTQTFKLRLTMALIKDAIRIDLKVKQQNVSWVSSVHRSEKKKCIPSIQVFKTPYNHTQIYLI